MLRFFSILILFIITSCKREVPVSQELRKIAPDHALSLNLSKVDKTDPFLKLRRVIQYLEHEQIFAWSFAHLPDGEYDLWIQSNGEWTYLDGGAFKRDNPLVLFFDYEMKGRDEKAYCKLVPVTNGVACVSTSLPSTMTTMAHNVCVQIPQESGQYTLLKTNNSESRLVIKLKLNTDNNTE